jgi:type IV secretory pathway VirJ component
MKTVFYILLLVTLKVSSYSSEIDTLRSGSFGRVTIYKPASTPVAFVIFISGDGGWDFGGVLEMAKQIVDQGAIVVGIDIRDYFKKIKSQKVKCYYPAGDFEELSLSLQKKYKFPQYMKPILVGYSSGATLVYGMLAQSPANTFKGAISLGFCPDIELDKTLCNGTSLKTHVLKEGSAYILEASDKLTAPFIVLQGMIDEVCPCAETEKYMQGMHFGELIKLPNVGHGFSVTHNWQPQLISSFNKIQNTPSYIEKITAENKLLHLKPITPLPGDMPLVIIPSAAKDTMEMVFMISGDGGWTSFDQTLGMHFAEKGLPIVGLDAQKYFWNAKTPEESSSEIARAVMHYMQQWNKKSFILVRYSFGACVAPFIADKFTDSIKQYLKGIYCLSPDETADFEVHIADMLEFNTSEKYLVTKEMIKVKALNPVCIFGDEEDSTVRYNFSASGVKVLTIPGNHHYNNDYTGLVDNILKSYMSED